MAENTPLIDIHEGRKHFYYFLARLFVDIPDDNMYEQITSMLPAFNLVADNNMIKEGCIGFEHFNKKREKKHIQISIFYNTTSEHNKTNKYFAFV